MMLGLALPIAWGSACSSDCVVTVNQPGCEDRFQASRIVLHPFSVTTNRSTRKVWTDSSHQIFGEATLGTQWTVQSHESEVIVGMPEAGLVVSLPLTEPQIQPLPSGGQISCEWTDWGLSVGEIEDEQSTLGLTRRGAESACDRSGTVGALSGKGEFGATLAVEDVDQDDRWDLWVGAPGAQQNRGKLHLFLDAANRTGEQATSLFADLTLVGSEPGDHLGSDIAICGDVNADGRPDRLIGSPRATKINNDNDEEVRTSMVGNATLLTDPLALATDTDVLAFNSERLWWGFAAGDSAGTALWCAGDLSGDGIADVAIGAPYADWSDNSTPVKNAGVVYVIQGGPDIELSGPLEGRAWRTLRGPGPESWCGMALTAADFDADGALDLAVGCPGTEDGIGSARVYTSAQLHGGNDPLPAIQLSGRVFEPTRPLNRNQGDPLPHYGQTLLSGDLEGLGAPSLLMGAPSQLQDDSLYDAGEILVWTSQRIQKGEDLNAAEESLLIIEGGQPYQRTGNAMHLTERSDQEKQELLIVTRRKVSN